MSPSGEHEIQRRAYLADDDERAAVRDLTAHCNMAEGLDLKLTIPQPGLDDERLRAFLVYDDKRLIGFCTLDGLGRPTVELCGMVDPDYRRHGLGSALLRAALEEAHNNEATKVLLICEDASASGRGFVQSLKLQRESTEHRMEIANPPEAMGERLLVREGTPDDAEEIDRVVSSAFGETRGNRVADVLADMASPFQRFFLGQLGDDLIASLKVFYDPPKAFIYGFGVQDEYRRQGYGRELISRVITQSMADGWAPVGLEVDGDNDSALALYRSLGFVETTVYGYYAIDPANTAS